MWLDLVLISAAIGLLCLDRVSVGQTMVSQPVVSLPLLGAWFGDLETGLLAGSVLQLFWLSANLYGANVPKNETMASLTAGGAAFTAPEYSTDVEGAIWVLAFLLTAPSAWLAQSAQRRLDHLNARLSEELIERVRSTQKVKLGLAVFVALSRSFVVHTFIAFCALAFSSLAIRYLTLERSGSFLEALSFAGDFLLPSLAIAVTLTLIRRRLYLSIGMASMIMLGAWAQV